MRWHVLLLVGGLAPLAGCHLAETAFHNAVNEPAMYLDEKHVTHECRAEGRRAVRDLRRQQAMTEDYEDGFVDGYADALERGGTPVPPAVPPTKYRRGRFLNQNGHARVHDYFAGFQHGATCATASGQRQYLTVPMLLADPAPEQLPVVPQVPVAPPPVVQQEIPPRATKEQDTSIPRALELLEKLRKGSGTKEPSRPPVAAKPPPPEALENKEPEPRVASARKEGQPNIASTACRTDRSHVVALDACSELIERFPDFAEAYFVRGWALSERRDFKRAIEDLTRVVELNPYHARAFALRARAHHTSRAHNAAIDDYSRAIELSPKDAALYNNRGLARTFVSDLPGALVDYNRAIELNPNYALAYYNRGRVHWRNGRKGDLALADLTRAIELDARLPFAFSVRADIYAEMGKHADAISDFTRVIEVEPRSSGAYVSRSRSYIETGDFDKALSDANRAIELFKSYKKIPDHRIL